ncbi:dihydrofolate reductase [Chryseomicrobium sp. FSL W7-1435]|uniref:dihydrofolate reductase n=1 Tax=Chryseomicrobium sp. FSL W7-1435 TaxID=2921704 RepID=UPI003159D843
MISFIVAHDENRVIGYENKMPWHIPEDLAYFKKMTLGKPIVMGRNTFESIGRPLPGRENIVITRNEDYTAEGIHVFHSYEDGIAFAKQQNSDIMVIGGAQVFKDHLETADELLITQIHQSYTGDTYFPAYSDWHLEWQSEKKSSSSGVSYTYQRYVRKASE